MQYNIGDTVQLKDNRLSEHSRTATIIADNGDGYYTVKVDEVYEHDFCANSDTLWCHYSQFRQDTPLEQDTPDNVQKRYFCCKNRAADLYKQEYTR